MKGGRKCIGNPATLSIMYRYGAFRVYQLHLVATGTLDHVHSLVGL